MANYSRMVHKNGQRKPKRIKVTRTRGFKPKFTYWDVLKQADSNPDIQPESGVLRTSPQQNTGMHLSGDFLMIRDKGGRLVFIDETGQIVRKQ